MTRVLWWKELRAQAPLVLAACTIALVLPLFLVAGMLVTTPNYEFSALGEMLSVVLLFLVWPVFAAGTGAMTVAADTTDGSLHFLLSRPVSRTRVWVAKVGTAAVALALIVAGSGGLALGVDSLVSGGLAASLDLVELDWSDLAATAVPLLVLSALFVSAHYCSLFFRRPLAAALAGAIVAAAMSACVIAGWTAMVPPSRLAREAYFFAGVAAGVPLAVSGLLVAAWWVFSRGEVLGGNAARRMAVPLVVVTVFVMLVGAGPALYAGTRSMASLAAELPLDFRMVDGSAVLADVTPSTLGTRLALVDLHNGDVSIVANRHATTPVLSDDGALIAYASFRGPLVAISGDVEIRLVRRDGTDDRAVSASVPWWWESRARRQLSISPDLEFVAVYNGRYSVSLEPLNGGARRGLRLSEGEGGHLIGWTRGIPSELLYYRFFNRGRSDARTELVAFDPSTVDRRVVAEFPGTHNLNLYGSSWRGAGRSWNRYPVWIEDDGDERLYVIDTATGATTRISDRPCPMWGSSPDGKRVVYGNCSGSGPEVRAELRLRDLSTGFDEPFAVLDPIDNLYSGRDLYVSPDTTRVAAFVRRGSTWGTYVISREGSGDGVDLLATANYPIGWLDDRHLVVVNDRWPELDIEVINVETNVTRKVYTRQ